MGEVTVVIDGRSYPLACRDGEESHLAELASMLDSKIGVLTTSLGTMSEPRLLLMAGILIADELFESRQRSAMPPVGGTMPPIGGAMPPVGGAMPPVGGAMPPVGGATPPVGGATVAINSEHAVDDSRAIDDKRVMAFAERLEALADSLEDDLADAA